MLNEQIREIEYLYKELQKTATALKKPIVCTFVTINPLPRALTRAEALRKIRDGASMSPDEMSEVIAALRKVALAASAKSLSI